MSSPEPRRRRIRALALALALAVPGALLGACDVQPLYGSRSGMSESGPAAAIEIAPVKDRVGHIVRNHLIDSLTPGGQPAQPEYRLTLAVEESETPLLIQLDDHATRFNLRLDATFSLEDREGEQVYSGSAQAIGSFNVVESGFATVTAKRDAADEAARVLSEEIRTLILLNLPR